MRLDNQVFYVTLVANNILRDDDLGLWIIERDITVLTEFIKGIADGLALDRPCPPPITLAFFASPATKVYVDKLYNLNEPIVILTLGDDSLKYPFPLASPDTLDWEGTYIGTTEDPADYMFDFLNFGLDDPKASESQHFYDDGADPWKWNAGTGKMEEKSPTSTYGIRHYSPRTSWESHSYPNQEQSVENMESFFTIEQK
jgi:hypothetical protein